MNPTGIRLQDGKGTPGVGVDRELPDEITVGGELNELAGLSRIDEDGRVRIRGDEVAVGCDHQAERPVQVSGVRKGRGALAGAGCQIARVCDGEDLVVGLSGDVEDVALLVVCEARRTYD